MTDEELEAAWITEIDRVRKGVHKIPWHHAQLREDRPEVRWRLCLMAACHYVEDVHGVDKVEVKDRMWPLVIKIMDERDEDGEYEGPHTDLAEALTRLWLAIRPRQVQDGIHRQGSIRDIL